MPHHLITGGARSGKSRYAETLALAHPGAVVYVATAECYADDAEFAARIRRHQARRPAHWHLLDSGPELAAALRAADAPDALLLVDCVGMWLMRFFDGEALNTRWAHAAAELLDTLGRLSGQVLFVTNETGWGVVGDSKLTRRFVDELGRFNQVLAEHCAQVTLVACGLPLALKGGT